MLEGIVANATLQKLQAGIAFTARRHELIANNIANVTTPGFRAKDLSERKFIETLERTGRAGSEGMSVIDSPDAGPPRDDGNNVSIESEMSKLSGNAIMHNVLISLLSKQFRMLESALRERIV
ncbi:MAG TPA: flagellar basal body protein [Planctomycetota bacterium]|nr:flagellar basal body protein [Planctomycetota bacterium]